MSIELEREKTYLAKTLPSGLDEARHILIRDIYIPDAANHARLRLRQRGDVYEATKKIPVDSDPSHQTEHTIPLARDEFEALAACSTKTLQKQRFYIEIEGHGAEVDVYEGALAGLVVIDFEFADEVSFQNFSQPDIALADVTDDEIVGGGFLAGKSYEDIEAGLAKYNYQKLEVKL